MRVPIICSITVLFGGPAFPGGAFPAVRGVRMPEPVLRPCQSRDCEGLSCPGLIGLHLVVQPLQIGMMKPIDQTPQGNA